MGPASPPPSESLTSHQLGTPGPDPHTAPPPRTPAPSPISIFKSRAQT